jgi:hypothetical protein
MNPTQSGADGAFDRQCRFVSAVSWCLAWWDLYALWPLEVEERKEFRKKMLLEASALTDDALRSEAFVELLGQFLMGGGGDTGWARNPGCAAASPPREPQQSEVVKEALRTMMQLMGEEEDSGDRRGATAGHRNGAEAGRGGVPGKVREDEESGRGLLDEVRETNRQLKELLTLQRAMLERIGEQTRRPEESRNGAKRTGEIVP